MRSDYLHYKLNDIIKTLYDEKKIICSNCNPVQLQASKTSPTRDRVTNSLIYFYNIKVESQCYRMTIYVPLILATPKILLPA